MQDSCICWQPTCDIMLNNALSLWSKNEFYLTFEPVRNPMVLPLFAYQYGTINFISSDFKKWMRIVGEFSHCPVQGMKVLMCIITYMPEHSQNTMCQMDIKEKLGVKLHLIQIWKLHVLVDDVLVKIPGNIIVYKQNLYKYVHKFQN